MAEHTLHLVPTRTAGRHSTAARCAHALLAALACTVAYLSFFAYKAGGFDARSALASRLSGHDDAPYQYRVGVYALAQWLADHLHLRPSVSFAVLDGLSCLLATWLLLAVLLRAMERWPTPHLSAPGRRWIATLAFTLAVGWFLAWIFWLQKPETLPAAALLAAMLFTWSSNGARPVLHAALLLVLNLALVTIRADLALCLALGVLFAALQTRPFALPRAAVIALAGAQAITAAAAQWWLARVVYPQANYGLVKLWQLWPNVHHISRWPPFVLFLLPLLWMSTQLRQSGWLREGALRGVACGALLYAALWCTFGKIDEVRIFLPFAFALTPGLVLTLLTRINEEAARERTAS